MHAPTMRKNYEKICFSLIEHRKDIEKSYEIIIYRKFTICKQQSVRHNLFGVNILCDHANA